jgi:hypothetical protein
MLPTKLRKRRAPLSHGDNSILPLHQSQRGGVRSSLKGHRKKGSYERSTMVSVLVFSSVASLGIFGVIRLWVLGTKVSETPNQSLAERMRRYRGSVSMPQAFMGSTKQINETVYPIFRCSDGVLGYLNDDYCDCSDGQDEVSTAACSNILIQQQTFQCRDGSWIYSSRVRDGIYDCLDKSDEA